MSAFGAAAGGLAAILPLARELFRRFILRAQIAGERGLNSLPPGTKEVAIAYLHDLAEVHAAKLLGRPPSAQDEADLEAQRGNLEMAAVVVAHRAAKEALDGFGRDVLEVAAGMGGEIPAEPRD